MKLVYAPVTRTFPYATYEDYLANRRPEAQTTWELVARVLDDTPPADFLQWAKWSKGLKVVDVPNGPKNEKMGVTFNWRERRGGK